MVAGTTTTTRPRRQSLAGKALAIVQGDWRRASQPGGVVAYDEKLPLLPG